MIVLETDSTVSTLPSDRSVPRLRGSSRICERTIASSTPQAWLRPRRMRHHCSTWRRTPGVSWQSTSGTVGSTQSFSTMISPSMPWLFVGCLRYFDVHQAVERTQEMCSISIHDFWSGQRRSTAEIQGGGSPTALLVDPGCERVHPHQRDQYH